MKSCGRNKKGGPPYPRFDPRAGDDWERKW
jgi:hypothetical protein